MRVTALVVALLLAASCGGGAADPVEPGGNAEDPAAESLAPYERAWEILQTCALSELESLADLVETFQDAARPGATPPTFEITGFDLRRASVSWILRAEGEGPADVAGTLRFEDAAGNPTFPFDLSDLLRGSFDLASLYGAIADGTVVIVEYRILRGTDTSGTIAFQVADGQPQAAWGTLEVNGDECRITLEFEALRGDGTPGTYPEGTADAVIESDEGTLVGTFTFDGTSVVRIEMTLDGEETLVFEYDLATGELTG